MDGGLGSRLVDPAALSRAEQQIKKSGWEKFAPLVFDVTAWLRQSMVAKENNGSIVCRWRNYFQVGGARWLGLFTKKVVTLIR